MGRLTNQRPLSSAPASSLTTGLTGGLKGDLRGDARPVRRNLPVPVRRPPPRRSRLSLWLRQPLARAGAAGGVLLLLGGLTAVPGSGAVLDAIGTGLRQALEVTSAVVGLSVAEVQIEGQQRVPAEDVLTALGTQRGEPILAVDLGAARARLEKLPWVDSAVVERRLPHLLHVRLAERQPRAIWQKDGRFLVVDAKGAVIFEDAKGAYGSLPVVIGDDAPANADALLVMLASEPTLAKRVTAATRVGGRRWTLRIDNAIDVKLPEEDAAEAWSRLAQLDRNQQILSRELAAIDLRMPDRLIVQTTPGTLDRMRPPPPAAPKKQS